jgi:pyruvate/2-oxoglutarate dehydrogenase complex dihydrolipoamide dehydrogenase (E3) component
VTKSAQRHRIVVVGGGPGGYEAALAGSQLGAEVVLIEETGVGGNAVLTDVVPSKSLIAVSDAAEDLTKLEALGVRLGDSAATIDLAQVNQKLLALANEQSEDMLAALERAEVRVIKGRGRLDGNHTVVVTNSDGSLGERIETRTVVLATGASPRELPAAKTDGKRVLNWKQLYSLNDIPEHLIVVGSGVTGAEFASAYLALGSQVTLVSSRDQLLPGQDEDAARLLEQEFQRRGMRILKRSRAIGAAANADGVDVTLEGGEILRGSHCLMAVGSVPNTADLGLEEARVELTETGHIRVNKVAGTSRANVYAVGDCTDFMPLASVAAMQGRTAVFHAMGDIANPVQARNIASNVFTAPEIASVGWQESAILSGEVRGSSHRVELTENPRAKMMGIHSGFIKLMASTSGTVVGGLVVAPKASELILPIAIAVENRLTVDQLARTFAVYPSLSGSISDAARALHQPID